MNDVIIAAYARSPFTPTHKGALAAVRPDDLAAQVIKALVQESGTDPNDIEDLILGMRAISLHGGLSFVRITHADRLTVGTSITVLFFQPSIRS